MTLFAIAWILTSLGAFVGGMFYIIKLHREDSFTNDIHITIIHIIFMTILSMLAPVLWLILILVLLWLVFNWLYDTLIESEHTQ